MRICPYCGSPVEDDALFCTNCGANVSAPQAAPQQDPAFCPNCGARLPAGSAFCTNCGANVRSAPAPAAQKPGGRMTPRIIGISAAAVAVIALAAAIWLIPNLFASPDKKFISYQAELFIDALLSELESGANRYGSGSFSTDLTVTASVDDASINGYLDGSSVNLGIDLKKDTAVVGGELVLMGSPVLSGTVTYDDGQLGFLLPQADNTYYVMDLKKVAKNLFGVDLDPDSMKTPEISGKQWRALIEAYLDVVYATVNKDNVTEEKGRDVRLAGLGGSFTGTVYTFTPTAEDIEDMLIRLADRLESDKDLRDLILQMSGAATLAEMADNYGYYSDYGFSLEDELDRALLDLAGELRDEAEWIGLDVEDSGFSWSVAVEGKTVRQIRISVQDGSVQDGINAVVYEAEGAESDGRTELIYMVSGRNRQNLVERSYTRKGNEYDGRVTVTLPYEPTVTVTYKIDRGKTSVFGIPYGEYRVSVPEKDFSASMTVAAGANGGVDHTVTVRMNGLHFGYYYYDISRLQVTVNATDRSSVKKPSQRAVDISDYSEWELEDLLYGLGEDIGETLVSQFYNSFLFGGGFGYGW